MPRITWKFQINGTSKSLFPESWGLKFNPFPQHGKRELDQHDLALQSLAEINCTPEVIKSKLQDLFSQEFINSVVARYRTNAIVDCTVTCDWK